MESYEKYIHRYEEIQGDDVVANVVRIYDLYIEFCMEQGLGFIQSFYTPLNKSLDTRPKRGVDMAKGMPIMNQTILEIAKAKEQGHIRPEVDPDDFGFILCVLIKGCIFEWCVSDGEINLPAMSRKVLTGHMQSALTPEYFVRFPK